MFRVVGAFKEGTARSVAYGTGRYILPRGLIDVDETAQNLRFGNKELDDDQILECLSQQDAFGLELPGCIQDIGCPENWQRAILDLPHSPSGQ